MKQATVPRVGDILGQVVGTTLAEPKMRVSARAANRLSVAAPNRWPSAAPSGAVKGGGGPEPVAGSTG